MQQIIILGNARCYHTMDWYRAIQAQCKGHKVLFATDLIESEGHERITNENDNLVPLFNIDRLLINQSTFGHIWRNIVKLLMAPIQVIFLRRLIRRYPDAVVHAHTMYYLFLCWVARVQFIGTPQGSEILVRPQKSRLYRIFAGKALAAAQYLTVDSHAMESGVGQLCDTPCTVIQNGIDTTEIKTIVTESQNRELVVSIRGITPLYQIDKILASRRESQSRLNIAFVYPLWEEGYKKQIEEMLTSDDSMLGRLDRKELYGLLGRTVLAVSVPNSDSSPRTVYEAIFCGACVAVTQNIWIQNLPKCMRSRLTVVDLSDTKWFEKCYREALTITKNEYIPSDEAIERFDQYRSVEVLVDRLYRA
jgi:hypothetical protein